MVTVVAVDLITMESQTAYGYTVPVRLVNVDAHLESGQNAIFTGEDFETVSTTLGRPMKAVVIVPVNPATERLVCYDNQPDQRSRSSQYGVRAV